ncbi:MAG: XrtA system polysaccharide deacetylase [Candidatus Omnitrophota bacterium]
MINALGIDLEEWYHLCGVDYLDTLRDSDILKSRVEANTERLLAILKKAGVRATFFVLGSLAQRYPELVKRISSDDHEIACHGLHHREVYKQARENFTQDLKTAKEILQSITGRTVLGFRAPDFSITNHSFWAVDVLLELGFRYDCSIFPIKHPRYGIPNAPRFVYDIREGLKEFPPSTLRILGNNFPFAGGAYFRVCPYWLVRWAIKKVNGEGSPVNFYLHPWELDHLQPRIKLPPARAFAHYVNLEGAESKFRRLLKDFKFAPVCEVLRII